MNNIYYLVSENPARHIVRDIAGNEIYKARHYWLADKVYTLLSQIYQEKQNIARFGAFFVPGPYEHYQAVTATHRANKEFLIREYQYFLILRFMGLYSLSPDANPYIC